MQRRSRNPSGTVAQTVEAMLDCTLELKGTTEKPTFTSLEVSTRILTVYSTDALRLDAIYTIKIKDFSIDLEVIPFNAAKPLAGKPTFRLQPKDKAVNLESELFRKAEQHFQKSANDLYAFCAVTINGCYLRASRYTAEGFLSVMASTLGTRSPYRLQTVDISRSGMFLTTVTPESLPFAHNTLVEIVVKPSADTENKTLKFMGKVVRCVNSNQGSRISETIGVGVQIVEIDHDTLALWERCVSKAAKRSNHASDILPATA